VRLVGNKKQFIVETFPPSRSSGRDSAVDATCAFSLGCRRPAVAHEPSRWARLASTQCAHTDWTATRRQPALLPQVEKRPQTAPSAAVLQTENSQNWKEGQGSTGEKAFEGIANGQPRATSTPLSRLTI